MSTFCFCLIHLIMHFRKEQYPLSSNGEWRECAQFDFRLVWKLFYRLDYVRNFFGNFHNFWDKNNYTSSLWLKYLFLKIWTSKVLRNFDLLRSKSYILYSLCWYCLGCPHDMHLKLLYFKLNLWKKRVEIWFPHIFLHFKLIYILILYTREVIISLT